MPQPLIFKTAADPMQPGLERYTVSQDGKTRATATVREIPGYPDALRVQITADDDHIWIFAADALAATLRTRTGRLFAVARQDHPDAARLASAGYRLGWQSWGARLTLSPDGLPAEAYAELTDGPREAGYLTRELTLPSDIARVREAFDLYEAGRGDFPRTPATSVKHYDEHGLTAHIARNRLFAVIHNGGCVAITVFEAGATPSEMETGFTLVAADHWGRELASFLKATAIKQLVDEGVRVFRTGGASVNKPMLRSNEELGYVLEPFWGSYELVLNPDR